MAGLDLTTFAAGLKTLYTEKAIQNLVYKKNPFFAMLPKFETFTGDGRKIPVIIGNPQNRSNLFSAGQAETSSSLLRAFLITRKKNYSFGSIDNETAEASMNDAGAFMRAVKLEVDGALNSLGRSIAIQLTRGGTGAIGQLSASSGTTTTLTLADPEQSVNFEVGMCLESNATNATPVVNTSTGTQGKISAIARDTGVITLTTAITGLAAGDYLFPRGDGSGSITLNGLDAWLPYQGGTSARTTALAASFFGVTRSVDSMRLGGVVYDGSSLSIEEAIQYMLRILAREGSDPDYVFMNHLDYQNLIISLGSKVQYVVANPRDADVGFEGVRISGPAGTVTCLADMNFPVGYAYGLQMNTWELASLGKAVNLFRGDGLDLIRGSSADSLDFRCYSYAELGCYAPGWNGVVKLPS